MPGRPGTGGSNTKNPGARVLACGSTTDPIEPGAAGGSDAGSSGSTAGAVGLVGGGWTTMQGGSGGGGGTGMTGGSAGSSGVPLEDQPLLPLVPGHVSSFEFSPIDDTKPMTDTCTEPTTSIESGEGLSFDGHVGTLYRTFCAPEPFLIEGEDDELVAYEINDGELVPPAFNYIHSPVETGAIWDSGRGDQYAWEEVGEPLETPAGTFSACFHRHGTDTRITYCRGVGVVQALGPYGNYQLDLVEKNF